MTTGSRLSLVFIVCITAMVLGPLGCKPRPPEPVEPVEPIEPEAIKIGAVLPLTGSAAVWGKNAKMGIEIALDEINDNGGIKGASVEVLYQDSQSEPSKAVSALQHMISVEKVPAVIGDIASSSVLSMAPVAERNKVVLLSPGASNPDITDAGEFIFRNWQSDALEGEVDAEFGFGELEWRRVGVLSVNNAYGQGLRQVFEREFQARGGEIVVSETFEQGATDMRAQLNKIPQAKLDGVYLPGYPPEMAALLKQAKELGLDLPILSVQAFDDPKILELAGDAAEGVVFSVPKPPDPEEKIVADFIAHYKARHNQEPGVCSDTGYDALRIIAWAMRQAGTDADAVRKQLLELKDFPGAAGVTTFDEKGDVVKPFVFKRVQHGEFVGLTEQQTTSGSV